MRLRDMENMPLFDRGRARVMGRVLRGVVGDDFVLFYLVVELSDGQTGMIEHSDFELGPDAVIVGCPDMIKSYAHGEELSIYQLKVGDTVFDQDGRELGVLSDFIISPEHKLVDAVEVSAGLIDDLIDGRRQIPLEQVAWKSTTSMLVQDQGGDLM
ncbi:MAG: PRC-barrel domain-containing protein [Syntrophomonas sp.]